ncbi:CCA tRNA nucleotidyltransferase [Neobacillus thermocopriae]|uniref:CCA-adding enzyme n=1 Tax=Neobacillus thermocopriae TaxID=1215031 RepID=A0A6B3TTM2_9BACI|nr:CCA tRNA nucleotidyltransferase [Neobacillus thermocopriae]MED3625010.1 CCA tRNA nucleotidyltransferase [Neobacillus thermocopriae]MED3712792.1 CCA tRNA nucleotidyltransferase [Neobacillus thermocopriae]NEX79870.1 CCA tRNA nucleotidyltransferase [Neobacillus thermocopriae]
MIEPFLSAIPILKKLEDAGFEAYFVGGSVRDYLLNKPISDVDIATSATPQEVKAIFPKSVDIGIEHGTVLIIHNHQSYEVTTFRTEGEYQDYRRPKEVSFIRNLTEDLERRDFTMNAIAMDRNGRLIDPFNGQEAIKQKIIKTVGQATDRFQEDALRMMRAVRFVSQLSFQIEQETMKALTQLIPLLEKIAVERKRTEFEKLLIGINRRKAIQLLLETNLVSYLPGLKRQNKQIELLHTFECEHLNLKEMWSLLLYCLNHSGRSIETFLREWRLPVKVIKEIKQIILYLTKRLEQEWTVYDLFLAGRSTITSVEKLYLTINRIKEEQSIQYWIDQYDQLPIKNSKELDVTGSDLIEWFKQPGGPWVKESLLRIERAIIFQEVENEKRKIKEWLMKCSQN